MKTLTQNQIDFLLEYFFTNEKYAGWKNIATTLLIHGSCIVAGTTCIWDGGIGNFIKTSPAENTIDCSLYEFDLEYFLTSKWYIEVKNEHVKALNDRKIEIEKQLFDMTINISDITTL